jgi:hypothetical protein
MRLDGRFLYKRRRSIRDARRRSGSRAIPHIRGFRQISANSRISPDSPCATAIPAVANIATIRYRPSPMRQNGDPVNAIECHLRDTFWLLQIINGRKN